MTSIAAILLSWLLLYKYALLFGVFFLSALALPLPGNTLLFATGAFASQGYMDYSMALGAVFLGNVLGDVAGYALAAKYGDRFIRKFRIKRASLRQMESYVAKHPRMTIFLSRFGGTLDPVVNILSGLGEVSFKTFLIFDGIGNIASLWVVITAGFYFGDYWQTFSSIISTLGWIIFAVLSIVALVVIFRRQVKLSAGGIMAEARRRVRKFIRKHD